MNFELAQDFKLLDFPDALPDTALHNLPSLRELRIYLNSWGTFWIS